MSTQQESIAEKNETADKKEQVSVHNAQEAEQTATGVLLRQRRQEKGLSIRDISKETNISSSNLVAIEHENYTDLPADTFTRGQIAIYADFLNLDGVETARIFFQERDRQFFKKGKNRSAREEHPMSAKKLAEPTHISSATLAGGLLVLIIIFTAGFCLYTGWNPFAYFLNQEAGQVESKIYPATET